MSRINTNVSSLTAQSRLARSNKDLQTSLTRLSTGLKINSGADDPAGLIASEALRSDITGLNKALSNTTRAGQIIATADSALSQVSNLLNDIRGLVVEAANGGALSDDEIAANQLQVDSSLEAINRIAQTTTFQGRKLLDGSLDFLTSAGAGFNTVSDLQIDQANLGATGKISVDVAISQAATKASVLNTGIAATGSAVKSTGTITFGTATPANEEIRAVSIGNAYTVADSAARSVELTGAYTSTAQATGSVALGSGPGTFTVTAKATGAASGTRGNSTDVIVAVSASATAPAAVYDDTSNTLTVTLTDDADLNTQITALGSTHADFTFANGVNSTGNITSAQAASRVDPLSGGTQTNQSASTVNFTLDALDGGRAGGTRGNATTVNFTLGTANSAVYDDTNNSILVTVKRGSTVNDVISTINSNLTGDFVANGTVTNGAYQLGSAAATLATTTSGSHTTTASAFHLQATNNGAADGLQATNLSINYTQGTSNVATYDAATRTLAVTYARNATVADVANAITAEGTYQLKSGTLTNGTSRFSSTGATVALNTAGTNNTLNDVITVTAAKDGSTFNKSISFTTDNSLAVGAATAAVDGTTGNIVVTTKNSGDVALSAIVNAINGLEDYNATLSANAGDSTFTVGTDTPTIVNLTGGSLGGGLDADLVFQLTGAAGAETFQFEKGAKIESIIQSINLVKDATGVEARNDGGNLRLESTTYGSKSTVAIEVISEGTGGGFKTGLSANRATGSDIAATVNGYTATGDGNKLSINTATLDLSLTVAAGSSTAVKFDITGGGALFQLGGDVVSNQQARLGIGSLSTAKLGGGAGRLYELGSGQSKALATDAVGAGKVIDEVINKVTSIRGRLGAFQRTTLESNAISLTDTVNNLTEAESSIRDADFAKESASLTRAQVLIQSGTNVLGIANQSPQNVLALLR